MTAIHLLHLSYIAMILLIITTATMGCGTTPSAVETIATSRPPVAPNVTRSTDTPVVLPEVLESTPTLSPIPTATSAIAPLPTATKPAQPVSPSPSPTATVLPIPTNSPVREPEVAPRLRLPEDKSVFTRNVKFGLEWTWHRVLKPDEWFDVMVWDRLYGQPRGIAWTRTLHYEIAPGLFPVGEYNWAVRVLRDAGIDAEGNPQWTEVSPISEIFRFDIKK